MDQPTVEQLRGGAGMLSRMLSFQPHAVPHPIGVAVFVGAGHADPLVPAVQVERLAHPTAADPVPVAPGEASA